MAATNPGVHLLGVRHHGPGSARSILAALREIAPDIVLIEGPPEGDAVLPLLTGPDAADLVPPIALLVYNSDAPQEAAFYPFAHFSPEWVALRFAADNNIAARFMDLPQTHQLIPETDADGDTDSPGRVTNARWGDTAQRKRATDHIGSDTDRTGSGTNQICCGTDPIGGGTDPIGSGTNHMGSGTEPMGSGTDHMGSDTDHMGSDTDHMGSDTDGWCRDTSARFGHLGVSNSGIGVSNSAFPGPDSPQSEPDSPASPQFPDPPVPQDPIGALARAAGYDDGERWWEHMVEQRTRAGDLGVFAAIGEAMAALRETGDFGNRDAADDLREMRREAHMRTAIRRAQKDGFAKIAVVCGAWHVPALQNLGDAKADAVLLANLPRAKVSATWIPWTFARLSNESGYGAGIESPGWYAHLWDSGAGADGGGAASESARDGAESARDLAPPVADLLTIRWMARVAGLFRARDLDASPAHIIEATRLAGTLANLRGRAVPDLSEMNEATLAIFCHGDDAPLRMIREKLIVGDVMGRVPDSAPTTPLMRDLARLQKRLRLPAEAGEQVKELDLRNETDLARSVLLHRLRLLGINWGVAENSVGKGTFRETWRLRWQPEDAITLIERGVWGNSVHDAASGYALHETHAARELPQLTNLLRVALLADLRAVTPSIVARIETVAAVSSDVAHLMQALPSLANVLRYSDVRQTNVETLSGVVDGLVARIGVGLPPACASLNDEAASAMYANMLSANGAIRLLDDAKHRATWLFALGKVADLAGAHGVVAGRATRILLDTGEIAGDEAGRRMGLALSTAAEPAHAANWADGFLRDSGTLLLHDEALWAAFDGWISAVADDAFTELLPLLRRTFATFPQPERRQMGEKVRRVGAGISAPTAGGAAPFDAERAARVLPMLSRMLGL